MPQFSLTSEITSLRLDKDLISPGAATILAGCVKANTTLLELSVRHCPIVDVPATALAASVLACKQLLSFSKVPLDELRDTKKPLHTLKVLNAGMGPSGGIVAAGAAQRAPAITAVVLPYNKMGIEGGEAMAALLRSEACRLTQLDVRSNGIVGDAAKALAAAVLAAATLEVFSEISLKELRDGGDEKLALIGMSMGPPEALVIAGLLSRAGSKVAELNLDRNEILSEGCAALMEMLHTNTTLTAVRLVENKLGASAAQAVATMLTTNATLKKLDIGGNKLHGKDGGKLLADALEANKSLATFHAKAVKFPPKDAERLKKLRASREPGVHPPLEVKIG